MLGRSGIIKEDLEYIVNKAFIPWHLLYGKKVFITGGTGTIGTLIVRALSVASVTKRLKIEIIVYVRDMKKAKTLFLHEIKNGCITLVEGAVENLRFNEDVDFIIHCACPTASEFYVKNPVETIRTSLLGTYEVLELGRKHNCQGLVYLSSMEVYGVIDNEQPLTEDKIGLLDISNIRNSYPQSKRMCEALCVAYAKEYCVPAMSIRLAQTFGAGIDYYHDSKVFSMMARCVEQKKDIVLKTRGESKRPYLYTAQAVTAILTVLLSGKAGEAYNAGNPLTYCSIYEMGQFVAQHLAHGRISVVTCENENANLYPQCSYWNLDVNKLKKLGWYPEGDLEMLFVRMIKGKDCSGD